MLAIIGTVPDSAFPLTHGPVRLSGAHLTIGGREVPVNRGTPALLAAAVMAGQCIHGPEIYAFLVGDIGRGDGSRRLYQFLVRHLSEFDFQVMTFHYLQPDVDWHNRVLFAVEAMARRPILIADAGFMYAAKMSGQGGSYDLFTPDAGELAFLADEMAPHPFYTRGFILHQDHNVAELIRRAYQHQNAAGHLLVKGKSDHIANEKQIVEIVNHPSCAAMEAIGGTGDTLTGILSVLCGAGYQLAEAAGLAAKANRWTGCYAGATPATQVAALIEKIPQALFAVLNEYQKEKTHGRDQDHTAD
ncbi:MAG: sugar kinase [Desulfobacterales bacterium]|nr:sugar kinase [Desulfobacterales bacterium]